jgi:hypothetical protein
MIEHMYEALCREAQALGRVDAAALSAIDKADGIKALTAVSNAVLAERARLIESRSKMAWSRRSLPSSPGVLRGMGRA